jgi:hypothetical protein
VVKRRTHQILEVPELEDQEVFQTLIDLPVEEQEAMVIEVERKTKDTLASWRRI